VVAAAVETARPLVESKQHQLEIVLPREPVELDVDPLRISQALSNLLTNAAKYTDVGGLITLTAELDAARGLAITVADTGSA
jgi:two-component system CheB/CheR fusion protein